MRPSRKGVSVPFGSSSSVPGLLLTLNGYTLTWTPRDPNAVTWAVYESLIPGVFEDDGAEIDGTQQSADIRDYIGPFPQQLKIQAKDVNRVNFGPISNAVFYLS